MRRIIGLLIGGLAIVSFGCSDVPAATPQPAATDIRTPRQDQTSHSGSIHRAISATPTKSVAPPHMNDPFDALAPRPNETASPHANISAAPIWTPPPSPVHISPIWPTYIETNILDSDVIVRARHINAEAHITTETSENNEFYRTELGPHAAFGSVVYRAEMRHEFEVLEHLKGNGGNKIWGVVSLPEGHRVSSSEQEARSKLTYYMNVRNTQWDGKEAIVFLSEIENAPSGLRSDHYSLGQFLSDYHLESYLPATYGGWYPIVSAQGGASGAGESQSGFLLREQKNVSLGDWLAYNDPDYSVLSAIAVSGQSGDVTLSLEEIKTLVGMTEAELEERELSLYGLMIVVESPDTAISPATHINILTASSKPGGILLIWQTSITESEIEGYRILRRKQTDSKFVELADVTWNGTFDYYYEDTRDIQPETKYIYRLRAYGASGDIADARIAITTVPALEPLSGAASTSTPTASPTPQQPTATVVPTATPAPAPAPSHTPTPTATHTPSPAPTSTPDPTATPESSTGGGVSGAIDTPTPTHTPTATNTPTPAHTPTPTTAPTLTATPDGSGDVVSGQ